MITTKEELNFYLAADKFARGRTGKPHLLSDEIWKFQIALRKCEYYFSKQEIRNQFLRLMWRFRKRTIGIKLGFDISEGVFGAGLRINHFGNIIVSEGTKIGRWCDIHQGVNIGASNPPKRKVNEKYVPTIGDHAWIGPGVKIYGNIAIGNRVQIGANAVVGKSFGDDITLAGVPAKIISNSGTSNVDVAANPNVANLFFEKYKQFSQYIENEKFEAFIQ